MASGATPLDAVNVRLNAPLAVGVPPRVPVPFPLSVNVTPVGSAPFSNRVGIGNPVAITMNVPAEPTLNVALFPVVIVGEVAGRITVSTKFCIASVPTPLDAVNVKLNVPPAVGVPVRTPVPALNVTPVGSAPLSDSAGVGEPVAVTVNVPVAPTTNVVLLALVIAAGWVNVRPVRITM